MCSSNISVDIIYIQAEHDSGKLNDNCLSKQVYITSINRDFTGCLKITLCVTVKLSKMVAFLSP